MAYGELCQCCRKRWAIPRQLLGGYSAVLCCDCINDWHDQCVTQREVLRALDHAESKLAAAKHRGDGVDAVAWVERFRDAEQAMFEMAHDWLMVASVHRSQGDTEPST